MQRREKFLLLVSLLGSVVVAYFDRRLVVALLLVVFVWYWYWQQLRATTWPARLKLLAVAAGVFVVGAMAGGQQLSRPMDRPLAVRQMSPTLVATRLETGSRLLDDGIVLLFPNVNITNPNGRPALALFELQLPTDEDARGFIRVHADNELPSVVSQDGQRIIHQQSQLTGALPLGPHEHARGFLAFFIPDIHLRRVFRMDTRPLLAVAHTFMRMMNDGRIRLVVTDEIGGTATSLDMDDIQRGLE